MTIHVSFDRTVPLREDPSTGHNRWHPAIPPIATVTPGDVVVADTRDAMDGQLTADSDVEDAVGLELERGHPLTGPFWIEGAEPGDVVVVGTEAIEPDAFGYTVARPGRGLLGSEMEHAFMVRWTIADGHARSEDLPGVTIVGGPFMGVLGLAPSEALLATWSRRERDLSDRGGVVLLPDVRAAVPAAEPAAGQGVRTIPPRETGGNLDIKQAGVGSRVTLRVDAEGGLLSVGDAHFAQGDGEACCQAIEVGATARLRIDLVKAADVRVSLRYSSVEFTEPARPARRWFATTGIPVDQAGVNHDLDLYVAAQAAVREMIDYLCATRAFSREQAYALCSVAVDLRISELVNAPNGLVTAFLPLDIFDDEPPAP